MRPLLDPSFLHSVANTRLRHESSLRHVIKLAPLVLVIGVELIYTMGWSETRANYEGKPEATADPVTVLRDSFVGLY